MTEREWMTATDPKPLLDFLYPNRGHDSVERQTRMSRLYLLACSRRVWERLPAVCRVVIELTEQVYLRRKTDGALKNKLYPLAEELTHCRGLAADVNTIGQRLLPLNHSQIVVHPVTEDFDPDVWLSYAHLAYLPLAERTPSIGRIPGDAHSVDLVREIFGNLFAHYPRFDSAWRTETVLQLAHHAVQERDFSSLPMLADALEESGCSRDDVLEHFRHGGPHSRGCWALDLVLN